MSVMLDVIGASLIVGMIVIAVMNINIQVSNENVRGLTELHTQEEAIQLARIMEFDLLKAGYHITKDNAVTGEIIQVAESTHVKFKTDMKDVGGVNVIEYGLGGLNGNSPNPRDKMLFRIEDVSTVYINYSVTRFLLRYYRANDVELTSPVTGAWRDSIKSIRVYLMLESPEPFDKTYGQGNTYANAIYQKLIYPRNL